jgi:4-hydroxy-tetrahydrodipicolinate synthase
MPHSSVTGLVPILATPFDARGALDIPSLRRLVDFELTSGVDGIAVFGMASEGFALTASERETILAEVVAAVDGAVPVVAGVGATSTVTAIEQAEAALDGGAELLMVLPPFMVKPGPAQVLDFYGELASATGGRIMVQDAPGATGVTMPVPLIAELSALPGVGSIKVESPPTAIRIASIAEAATPGFSIFGGQNSQMLLEEYSAGSVGTMPACEFPDLLAPILSAWGAGERLQAGEAFTRLLPLILFGLQPGIAWAVHKEILVMRGIIEGATVRSPAVPIDDRTREAVRRVLAQLELVPQEAR